MYMYYTTNEEYDLKHQIEQQEKLIKEFSCCNNSLFKKFILLTKTQRDVFDEIVPDTTELKNYVAREMIGKNLSLKNLEPYADKINICWENNVQQILTYFQKDVEKKKEKMNKMIFEQMEAERKEKEKKKQEELEQKQKIEEENKKYQEKLEQIITSSKTSDKTVFDCYFLIVLENIIKVGQNIAKNIDEIIQQSNYCTLKLLINREDILCKKVRLDNILQNNFEDGTGLTSIDILRQNNIIFGEPFVNLKKAGIKTVDELSTYSKSKLKKILKTDEDTFGVIMYKLNKMGICIK